MSKAMSEALKKRWAAKKVRTFEKKHDLVCAACGTGYKAAYISSTRCPACVKASRRVSKPEIVYMSICAREKAFAKANGLKFVVHERVLAAKQPTLKACKCCGDMFKGLGNYCADCKHTGWDWLNRIYGRKRKAGASYSPKKERGPAVKVKDGWRGQKRAGGGPTGIVGIFR